MDSKKIEVREVGDVTVVSFKDSRVEKAKPIKEDFLALLKDGKREKFLVSFANVSLLSAGVLAVLITFDKELKSRKRLLRLCSLLPEIYDVFSLTRLDRLFMIKHDEAEGLASF